MYSNIEILWQVKLSTGIPLFHTLLSSLSVARTNWLDDSSVLGFVSVAWHVELQPVGSHLSLRPRNPGPVRRPPQGRVVRRPGLGRGGLSLRLWRFVLVLSRDMRVVRIHRGRVVGALLRGFHIR